LTNTHFFASHFFSSASLGSFFNQHDSVCAIWDAD
jgi:hypothetical protein